MASSNGVVSLHGHHSMATYPQHPGALQNTVPHHPDVGLASGYSTMSPSMLPPRNAPIYYQNGTNLYTLPPSSNGTPVVVPAMPSPPLTLVPPKVVTKGSLVDSKEHGRLELIIFNTAVVVLIVHARARACVCVCMCGRARVNAGVHA